MPLDRPTLTALRARVAADFNAALPGADSRMRRSTLDVLTRVHAGAMHGAYGYLDYLSDVLPDSNREDVVARWASILGVQRKVPTVATGLIYFYGAPGKTLPAGTVLVHATGLRFVVLVANQIGGGGIGAATIEAEEPGEAGNLPHGDELTFVSPISGVNAIATIVGGGNRGGVDPESVEQLRERVLEVLRDRPAGGKAADYVRWAKEVVGVTRAWVTENVSGLGTVGVQFVMDDRDDIIPASGDVSAVANHIEALRPVGAQLIVTAPTAVDFDLEISLNPDTSDIRAAVAASIEDLLSREAEPGGTILLSHIREAISISAGENDHQVVEPSDNVDIAAGEIAVLGTITWS